MSAEIDFEKMQGLLPAIVQDADSGEVLTLGFMNRVAFEQTLRVGYVTFFSRTRNQLWTSAARLRYSGRGQHRDRRHLPQQLAEEWISTRRGGRDDQQLADCQSGGGSHDRRRLHPT